MLDAPSNLDDVDARTVALLGLIAEAGRARRDLGRFAANLARAVPRKLAEAWGPFDDAICDGIARLLPAGGPASPDPGPPAAFPWFLASTPPPPGRRPLSRGEWVAACEDLKRARRAIEAVERDAVGWAGPAWLGDWARLRLEVACQADLVAAEAGSQHPRWAEAGLAVVGAPLAEDADLAASVDPSEVEFVRLVDAATAEGVVAECLAPRRLRPGHVWHWSDFAPLPPAFAPARRPARKPRPVPPADLGPITARFALRSTEPAGSARPAKTKR